LPTPAKLNPGLLALRNLPPFPPVATKLITLLRRENSSFREAVELMRSDAGLTAEVLRLANSASAGSRYPATTMLQALSVLGVNRITSLATTLCVGKLLKPVGKLPLMKRCWRHNLATAVIASKRSEECGSDAEKAYTFGLLAGIGRLALLVSDPGHYTELVSRAEAERVPLDLLERQVLGFDHREAGRWLVTQWKLPSELNAVVFYDESPPAGPDACLGRLIVEAGLEAERLGFGILYGIPTDPADPSSLEVAERVNQIEQDLGM
jgi:HD-like signal output (HDOD) protein